MKRFIFVFVLCIAVKVGHSQSAPNLSNASVSTPDAQMAKQLSSVPVNIFTGVPQIGVPLYSYNNSSNGLSLNISLNYFAGGIQIAEAPATAGLGWYLNAGGVVTRTVRGAPDDQPTTGFMYAAAIPTDFRSNGDKYYFDSLDTQQDIFQYNFDGQSGKFFIGKNGQIAIVPASKIKIVPTIGTGSLAQRIIAFRIITPDGTKYDFNDTDVTTITTKGADSSLFRSANSGRSYYSSWHLGQIISPFNTDTIKLTYTQDSVSSDFLYPQLTFIRNSDGVRTTTLAPVGTNSSKLFKISSILFPEKTKVSFSYGPYGLTNIKVSDTAFKYGYSLIYIKTYYANSTLRYLLKYITPYTSKEIGTSYRFSYNEPYLYALQSYDDTIQNKKDYWGYYNGANNGTNLIPQVNGYTWGANRNSDLSHTKYSSLGYMTIPNGGTTFFDWELNDHLPYTKDPHKISVSPTVATSNSATFSQIFKTKHQLVFTLDSTVSRSGSAPITGTGSVTVNIKSTDGTITYKSFSLSLYDLFYQGIESYVFNVPNGNYLIDKPAVTGTTITGSFPINITWENRLIDNTHSAIQAGGLRIKSVKRSYSIGAADSGIATIQTYKYINADGTSSGLFGDIPRFDYPYQETVNFGGVTTTSYMAAGSEPVSNMDYSQGNQVGYSRVEVWEGTTGHNIGKTVYDFTTMQDVNSGVFTPTFPYSPQESRDWGVGLTKKISVYDSTGTLVKNTTNTYTYDSTLFVNSNFKSIKLGNSFTYYNGDANLYATPRTRTYVAQDYYPISGRSYLASSIDTLFQANGSLNTSYANLTYDTNYNVIKIVSSFDKNRGLQLEKRLYYPYNYTLGGSIGKLRDSGILTTVVARENWITGDANPRIISGTITDYQQTNGYVKPLTNYALQSNSPISQTTIGAFNPAVLNRSSAWFQPQVSFISYDTKGNLLQSKNLQSGISNSFIMDYNNRYVIAKVTNASVNDIEYTSFESDGTGNWTIASALRDTLNAITGKKSYNLSNGNVTKSGLSSSQYYFGSVWAKTGAVVYVNGLQLTGAIATQNNWSLYTKTFTGITTVTISGSGLIDELRLHPKDANMVTSTYEPSVGATSTTDANNTIVYSEYDNLNRLKLVRDKDKNILKRYDFSDSAIGVVSTTPVWQKMVVCKDGRSGLYDTANVDTNPYSDTYNNVVIIPGTTGTNYCTCALPADHPDYKFVSSGACQFATYICYTSSTHVQINGVFQWKCIYHYKWSDNSISPDYTSYNSSSCSLGCLLY